MSAEGQNKIYQMVTDTIVAALESGTIPWQQQWSVTGFLPTSMSTGRPYRGVNPWLLMIKASANGFKSHYWGTFDRIAELSGMVKDARGRWVSPDGTPRGVRSGEKSTVVVFHKRLIVKDDTAEDGKKAIYILRYYRVFNADQADALPDKYYQQADNRSDVERLAQADAIIARYLDNGGPRVQRIAGNDASYDWRHDTVTLPLDEQFKGSPQLYDATFHELAHSTGAKSRLRRPQSDFDTFDHFGGQQYAKEELVAQFTAAMLDAVVGIDTMHDNSAAYIKNWLGALKNDIKLAVQAGGQAQRAADYIQGITFEDASE